jgi:hypothetical protein
MRAPGPRCPTDDRGSLLPHTSAGLHRSPGHRPYPSPGAGRGAAEAAGPRARRLPTFGTTNPAQDGQLPLRQDLRGLGTRGLFNRLPRQVAFGTLDWVRRREPGGVGARRLQQGTTGPVAVSPRISTTLTTGPAPRPVIESGC